MKRKPTFCVYILQLCNGALYTGHTRDLPARYLQHLRGRGGRCTRSFPPVRLAQSWNTYGTRAAAMRVEAFIKGCTRRQKEKLVADPALLPQMLRARTRSRMRLEPSLPDLAGY